MLSFKVKKIGNHWFPDIINDGNISYFCEKVDKFLTKLDAGDFGELTLEFEELGVVFNGINIIYFNEEDIVKYLTTDEDFNVRFVINEHEFVIPSYTYWMLENQFHFEFHKNSYRIHIY